ncbi:MAG TPA: response regulator, partial [Aggregatilineales bacterium]|nr:response regulator [Aggregatilineales bacterium]
GHTFPAEKHILEDQYILNLELGSEAAALQEEGLGAALERLDEQITTVAIIDDNPQDSRLIHRLLKGYKNYRVFESNNALDGLDLVRQRHPDLVITDLTMPHLDGFTLLEQLKASPETAPIPVIVLSGKSLTAAERVRLEGRIESVWTKGNFRTRDLVDHVVATLKDQPLAAEARTPGRAPEAIEPLKILVVDDNPFDSRLVKRILEAEKKFKVTEVRSGKEVFQAIRDLHPAFVILDIILPDMSGLDVLQRIREAADIGDTKVAILTAKDLAQADRDRLGNASLWQKATLDRHKLVAAVEQEVGQNPGPAR